MSCPCQTRAKRIETDMAARTGFVLEVLFGDGAPGGIHSNQITSARTGACACDICRRVRMLNHERAYG